MKEAVSPFHLKKYSMDSCVEVLACRALKCRLDLWFLRILYTEGQFTYRMCSSAKSAYRRYYVGASLVFAIYLTRPSQTLADDLDVVSKQAQFSDFSERRYTK